MDRAKQYEARVTEHTVPSDLCNGSEWDMLSQKIWAKFDENRQSRAIFDKKMLLWHNLSEVVEVSTHKTNNNFSQTQKCIDP